MFPCEISLQRGKFVFSSARISNPPNKAVPLLGRVSRPFFTSRDFRLVRSKRGRSSRARARVRALESRAHLYSREAARPGTNTNGRRRTKGPGGRGDVWGLWGHVHTKRPLQTPAAVHHPCPTLHARSLFFSPAFLARLNLALPPPLAFAIPCLSRRCPQAAPYKNS